LKGREKTPGRLLAPAPELSAYNEAAKPIFVAATENYLAQARQNGQPPTHGRMKTPSGKLCSLQELPTRRPPAEKPPERDHRLGLTRRYSCSPSPAVPDFDGNLRSWNELAQPCDRGRGRMRDIPSPLLTTFIPKIVLTEVE